MLCKRLPSAGETGREGEERVPDEPVPDERVQAATAHWAPRFVANGTDYMDFQATLQRIARWDEWCREWGRTAAAYERLAQRAEQQGRTLTAAGAWRRAALCWHWGKFLFTEYPDEQRAAHERTVACYARGARALEPPAERVEIPYQSTRLAAYLRLPAGGRPVPAVVMVPGLDSVKEELQATAEYLLRRGLATLAVDGPGQGEAEYELPIEPAYERVVTACFDWLERRPEADPERLGVFGVSLGGYYAARAAAFEPRARATVALAGPYSFDRGFEQLPVLTRAAFQRRSGATSPEAARERAAALTLAGVADRITAPLLVVFGRLDRIIAASHAERLAAEAPGAELAMFEDGNHGLTNHVFESRSLMADWLAEHLKAA
jgi:dipeptidyl aminopeptidase/acylaminoacyl peptidase